MGVGNGVGGSDSETRYVISALRRYFEGRRNVSMAFLFGSVAKGRHARRSDVDVAIHLREPHSVRDALAIGSDLEHLLRRDADVIVLDDATPSVAWAALRGIPLLIDNQAFHLNYLLDVSREAEEFGDTGSLSGPRRGEGGRG